MSFSQQEVDHKKSVSFDASIPLEIEPKAKSSEQALPDIEESNNSFQDTMPLDEDEDKSCCGRLCEAFSRFLFPKLTPISASKFIVLTVLVAVPVVLYIYLFTKMGIGLKTFLYLSQNFQGYTGYLGLGIASMAFFLYLFDCYYWSSRSGVILRNLFLLLIVFACGLFALFTSSDYPFGPIALFIVLIAFWMIGIGRSIFKHVPAKQYVSWLSGPFFCVSFLVFVVWFTWTFLREENEWNPATAEADAAAIGCDVDADEQCYNAFIVWIGPFLISLGLLFLSFFASFLRPGTSAEQETTKFARIWMFLLFGMWVGASLAGAGAGVSTTLAALTLALFIAAAIILAISFEKVERKERLNDIGDALVEKYGNHFDVFRGLLIVTCTPIFMIYFVISFIIQRIRSVSCFQYSKPPSNTQSLRHIGGNGWLTIEARRLLREFQSWNKTKVYTYAIYWGLAFMVMSVIVSQFTLLFLSWLIEKTEAMSLGAVTGLLVAIGMTMFLLPPVPGVPIYLTLGIVILPVGQDTMGIYGSIFYALGVSLCLKLLACTLQQKMIGGLMQNSVSVRQFCSVNSNLMRSMKLVLQEKGIGIAKVSILVGGPDWPTSVLCGIMDLELIPILVGTLPIIFLITPTLLTGSFTYMASVNDGQDYPWAGTLAAIFAAITGVVQFGSMVVAAYYLEQTVSTRGEELEAIPIDEEVREADEKDEAISNAYNQVTEWSLLPLWSKFVLGSSLATMITSCYLVQLFADKCFTEYQLTYTIDEHLDGDWKNLVKPLGIVANILLLVSCLLLYIFRSWAMRKARNNITNSVENIPP
ncbi:hypothetical protein CTEN210_07657 [Chaetoceros tenuissimus]|uniref:Uncharacterized protein n=1 Tax=Chaetoceros tenuissimus TaxID=426638 RepID=A0AAD3H5B5_9STRA|nr:hypothetical protein CTEN210_07657 [Chaetoceros tenuissimus]